MSLVKRIIKLEKLWFVVATLLQSVLRLSTVLLGSPVPCGLLQVCVRVCRSAMQMMTGHPTRAPNSSAVAVLSSQLKGARLEGE